MHNKFRPALASLVLLTAATLLPPVFQTKQLQSDSPHAIVANSTESKQFPSLDFAGRVYCKTSHPMIDDGKLPVGFEYADADSDGSITRSELRKYLKPRLKGIQLPYAKVFKELDEDDDKQLTKEEFEPRNEVIQKFVEEMYPEIEIADAPGQGYPLFKSLDESIDDSLVYSAVYHRTLEVIAKAESTPEIDVDRLPRRFVQSYPSAKAEPASTLENACKATVVLGGGNGEEDFFTGGGVIVSPDGLLLTNWHVAQSISDGLVAILADGRVFKVKKLLAANPDRDVALVQLEGKDFPYVPLAKSTPPMASDIVMVHHSENRFYTYDRGYVKRYPKIQGDAWMEVSSPFAPGGSGCGIFNDKFELVGLICFISIGDGPSMSSEPLEDVNEEESLLVEEPAYLDMSNIVVRFAVPLQAIQDIWSNQ